MGVDRNSDAFIDQYICDDCEAVIPSKIWCETESCPNCGGSAHYDNSLGETEEGEPEDPFEDC